VWEFGDEASAIIPGIMRLRESLREYIDINMARAASTGIPLVRAMAIAFPNDPGCLAEEVEDQYMFGPDWLVAPVYVEHAVHRRVYLPLLPNNQSWQHYYSRNIHKGGRTLMEKITLKDFPLYHRMTELRPKSD
jgi:alpha-D-xyloside xylohydrolase